MFDQVRRHFAAISSRAEFMSIRVVRESNEMISVRRRNLDPVSSSEDLGAMITVVHEGGLGYAASPDLSPEALARTADQALGWARRASGRMVFDTAQLTLPSPRGEYVNPVEKPWRQAPLADKISLLQEACASMHLDSRIVDTAASLWFTETETLYLTNQGGDVVQRIERIAPYLQATANHGAETQVRTLGGRGYVKQAGLEALEQIGFAARAHGIAADALELLAAPNCPTGKMDLLLEADQMILQIHESIGHPLEIDRILGDERNYAGTSFVGVEDFGKRRYGSDLLNITFDPEVPQEFASYGFDDDGVTAERQYIIKEGILLRGLGSAISQHRAGVPGVANSRACSWNRPPIDRMANLNLEPGDATMDEMIASIEEGVLMRTNCSWSIDDSRNKFQFGCEWGRMIRNGELAEVVKNCNYRGISESFWKSLARVGDRSTMEVLGSPFCGKGEPNQIIRVGHASPACLFKGVDVFGGE